MTTLNDSGAGSFRDAVSQPNRIIVFDVGGVINLTSAIDASSNLTIAGQTAPGGGISITGRAVSFAEESNVILRYLRLRPGDSSPSSDHCLSLYNANNVIVDHTSMQFGKWNNIGGVTDNGGAPNITIQNSIIANPIDHGDDTGQGFGAHLESVKGNFTIANNLWANSHNRNPLAKINEQFINNISYNNEAFYTTHTGTPFKHDLVNNAFIQGPAGGTVYFQLSDGDTFYATGNVEDSNLNGVLDGSINNPTTGTIVGTPNFATTTSLPTLSVADAYAWVTAHAGASLSRDDLDSLVVSQVQTLGNGTPGWTAGTTGPTGAGGGLYHDAFLTGLSNGGLGTIAFETRPAGFDTDNDGIADAWEATHGLSSANASDSLALDPLGYRMIEQYFNELAEVNDSRTWTGTSGAWTDAAKWTSAVAPSQFDYTSIQGDGVNNSAMTISSGTANALRLRIGGNGPAAGESVTVSGSGTLDIYDTVHVGYENNAALNISGGTVDAWNMVLGNTVYSPGATNYNGVVNLSSGTLQLSSLVLGAGTPGNWNAGGSLNFSGGRLKAIGQLNVNVPVTISGTGGTIDTNGNDGTMSGPISGGGGITKIGTGALNLTGNNSFTGGILLQQGAVGIGSDANAGGAASAITFQGGTLRINGTSLTNIESHAVNWSSFNGGIDVANAAHTFTVNSNISGSGAMTKSGAGVLVLAGTNSHTGGTILKAGTTAIASSSNIGGAGSSISFQGGVLRILGTGMSNLDNHAVNWSSFNGGFDIADANHTFVVNQVIGGSGGLIKNGAGTLELHAANTFTGDLILNEGALKMGHPQAIQFATMNFTGNGTVDLNGYNLSIGGIAGGGGFDLKGGTLTVGGNDVSTTFSGVINDSVGGGRLVKIGDGNLTLTSSSNAMGGIIVNEGGIGFTANVSASGASPFGTSSTGVLLDGGKLARTSSGGAAWDRLFTIGAGGGTLEGNTGYVRFNSTGTVPMSGDGDRTLTLLGNNQQDDEVKFKLVDPAVGKLSLTKSGTARWIISVASGQAWTYSGDTTIAGGTFLLNGGSNILPYGAGKGNLVINSGTFDMSGKSININGLNGTSSGRLYHRNSTTVTLTLGYGDADGTYPGTITDVGTINVIKTGSGKQIFSGTNSYAGTTTVNGGVLQFNSTGAIGGSGASVQVNSGAAAAAGFAISQTFINRLNVASSGAAALAANSGGSISFASYPNLSLGAVGSVAFTGTLVPNGTTYRLGGGGGSLLFSNANVLTGARSLLVTGGATIVLSNSNNYTNGTTVNGGMLIAPKFSGNGSLVINGGAVKVTAKPQANDPAGLSVVPSLTIGSGVLDLTNNSMVIDYSGSAGTLENDIRVHMLNGRIVSSSAGTPSGTKLGYADDTAAGSLLIKFTYAGDANLDGQVTISDLGDLASNWQSTVAVWRNGDFNYDGQVTISDLGDLASNWQAGVGSPLGMSFNEALAAVGLGGTTVPEPATAAMLLCGIVICGARVRKLHV